jgi:hypothetical protein
MNDKELLELAAKAVGIELLSEEWKDEGGFIYYYYKIHGDTQGWNPLNSDADALRLAVKLNMTINIGGFCHWGAVTDVTTPWHIKQKLTGIHPETHGDDPYAATRRAIVRAAAEIAKAEKQKKETGRIR